MSRTAAAAQRLRKAAEFEHVLKHARRTSGRNFSAWMQPNDCAFARLGIIAGRKAAPRAVDRNRGKRLIREVFRASMQELAGLDLIVQMRTPLLDSSNEVLRSELRLLFEKLRTAAARQSYGR